MLKSEIKRRKKEYHQRRILGGIEEAERIAPRGRAVDDNAAVATVHRRLAIEDVQIPLRRLVEDELLDENKD